MTFRNGFLDSIGRTPMIRLRRASELTGCDILGKAEFLNPGGSVKDRAALAIIQDAEARGAIRPGGTIVEGTAGNTGIGLALVGNARGYRTVIVMPDTQSQEKKDFIQLIGADLRLVPAAPYSNPGNYVHCPTARSGPTSSTIPPIARATAAPPDPRYGTTRMARSMPSPAPPGPAALWPGSVSR